MRWIGYKKISFKSITLDAADIRKRSKLAHVADLASDIRDKGQEPIHAPTVRMPGGVLLCGRDRMAALLTLKTKKLWVRLCECTDAEAADLEASENVHRRNDNRNDVLARAVIVKEQLLTSQQVGTVSSPAAAKIEARKQVARAAGVTVGAVKKAQQRAKAAERSAPADETDVVAEQAVPEAAPTLDLLGVDDVSTRAVMKYARKDQDAIDKADKLLRLAQAALNEMTAGAVQQELYGQVHRVASLVRSHRPDFICPWCKGLPKASFGVCGGCAGAGYVAHDKAGRAPKELRELPALVSLDGVFMPYEDVRDGKLPAKNGKPAKPAAKKVRVVDEHNQEIPLDADEAY